jgi:hypothetical protein
VYRKEDVCIVVFACGEMSGGSFGARDLALLLPDEVGETIAFKPKGDDDDKLEKYQPLVPRVDTTKKTR